jgi:hypothetical protein
MASNTVYHFNGGWLRPAIAREGRNQRAIRRALTGYDRALSTMELARAAFVRLDGQRLPPWRLYVVRQAARRYAEPLSPRTKPLRWRLKQDPERG